MGTPNPRLDPQTSPMQTSKLSPITNADSSSWPHPPHTYTRDPPSPHTSWGPPWYHTTLLLHLQGFPTNNENLTYTEMPAAIPCSQSPTSPTAPQSPVIYTTVSTDLPR